MNKLFYFFLILFSFSVFAYTPYYNVNQANVSKVIQQGGAQSAISAGLNIDANFSGTANNSMLLNGQIPAYYLDYANFSGVPDLSVYSLISDSNDASRLDYGVIANPPSFVPYTGATADVNLNSKNFSTVGLVTFDNLTVKSGGGALSGETIALTANMANMTGSETSTLYRGLKFFTNISGSTLTKITKHSLCTADTAYLLASDATTVLASASFVGDDATFSYALNDASNYYAVAKNSGGTSYEGKYSLQASWGGESYPIAGTALNLIATRYDTTDLTSNAVAIVSVGVDTVDNAQMITLRNGDVNLSHNLYIPDGNSYATNHIDFTPFYTGTTKQALSAITNIKGTESGNLNHETLPDFAKAQITTYIKEKTGENCYPKVDWNNCTPKQYEKDLCPISGIVCYPKYAIVPKIIEGRSLGAMVSLLVESVKELEKENIELKAALCVVNKNYSFC